MLDACAEIFALSPFEYFWWLIRSHKKILFHGGACADRFAAFETIKYV
jgi:hypothetical protein